METNKDSQLVSDTNQFAAQADKEARTYKGIPVVYLPHKAALRPLPTPGLSALIQSATSVQEVNNLLSKGQNDYKNVSPKTVRKWQKIAKQRIEELSR